MQQPFFAIKQANEKVSTNKHKAQGLGQVFFPKGAGTVKNCSGHESENQWRVDLGTKKNDDGSIDECFDLEVAKKVSCTLSCLMGAGTFDKYNRTDEQEQLCQIMNMLTDYNHTIEVILFLEGDFEYKTRRKTMIMEAIQKRLKGHFKGWFNSTNCKVIDSNVKNNDVNSKIL